MVVLGDTGPVSAETPTAAQIIEALKPKPRTRTLAPTPEEQRKAEEDRAFIESLRKKTRSVTLRARDRTNAVEITGQTRSFGADGW
jgi:hypothetical protein